MQKASANFSSQQATLSSPRETAALTVLPSCGNTSAASTESPTLPRVTPARGLRAMLITMRQWFDSDYFPGGPEAARAKPDRFEWQRALPGK